MSVLSSVEFRGLPLRDRKDEREGGVNALFVGMQMSARYRQGAVALCLMHNAEVLIIMVMSGEIRSMQMQELVRLSLDRLPGSRSEMEI